MFKFISSLFGYEYESQPEPIQPIEKTNLLNEQVIKFNCTYCFNSFNTLEDKTNHLLICKQKPKIKSNII